MKTMLKFTSLISYFFLVSSLFLPGMLNASERYTELNLTDLTEPVISNDILNIKPLVSIMRKLSTQPEARLNVRYPGDDKGTKWANKLQTGLISLGLESRRIIMSPDSYRENIIELKLEK